MNLNNLKNNIEDKSLLLLNKNGIFTILFDNYTYLQIKSIEFDFSSPFINFITKNNEIIKILLPVNLLKIRKNINQISFLSFRDYFENNQFQYITFLDNDVIEVEYNSKDFIEIHYKNNFIFGNFKKNKKEKDLTNFNLLINFLN
jgi:hypothetical protein